MVIRVAYAEDHVAVRKGIIASLNDLGGISVDIQADNGLDMLQQLTEARKLPDICMIDINMPTMNGFILLDEIKKRWPWMRTLILTVFKPEDYVIRMIQQGANGYLPKDCEPAEIKQALQTIHSEGYYYSSVAGWEQFTSVKNKTIKPIKFSDRELEFLTYCPLDLSYAEIAAKMNASIRSVEGYRDRVFAKTNIKTRAALVTYVIQSGIVPLEIPNQLNNNNNQE